MKHGFSLEYPGESTRFALSAAIAIIAWLVLIVCTLGMALLYVLFFFIAYLFAQSAFISYLRGSAVKITPEQFPDLHARLAACAQRLDMTQVPTAYLLHADGYFNALATRFLGRDYVVLFSSVVDALHDRPDAVDFYIGHELGHIRRKHLQWGPVLALAAWLPLLGAALRRAQEYTCDRHGLAASPTPAAAMQGLAALAAGHSRQVDFSSAAFEQQRHDVRGFWGSYHELTGDYPWLSKRAHALSALSRGEAVQQPGRNPFAFLLALFTPRIPGAGGAGLLIMVAVVAILAAVAIPAYQGYMQRNELLSAMEETDDWGAYDGSDSASSELTEDLETLKPSLLALAGMIDRHRAAYAAYVSAEQTWPEDLGLLGVDDRLEDELLTVEASIDADRDLEYRITGAGMNGNVLWIIAAPSGYEGDRIEGVSWSCSGGDVPVLLARAVCARFE